MIQTLAKMLRQTLPVILLITTGMSSNQMVRSSPAHLAPECLTNVFYLQSLLSKVSEEPILQSQLRYLLRQVLQTLLMALPMLVALDLQISTSQTSRPVMHP